MAAISKAQLEKAEDQAAQAGYEDGFEDGRESGSDAAYEDGVDAGWDEADEYYKGVMRLDREDFLATRAEFVENLKYCHEALARWRYIAVRRFGVGLFIGTGLTVAVFLLLK